MRKLLLCAVACASVSPILNAESALDPIIISGTRSEIATLPVPSSIIVISRDAIEKSGARTVVEVLRGHAGIQIRDLFGDGSTASIDIRGFGSNASSNTLVMIDGRRLNSNTDSATLDLGVIDLENIERIEIIEGSAGTLFGNQAVGGVINIITRSTDLAVQRGAVQIGSYGSRQLSATLQDNISDNISFRLYAKSRRSDNYRDNNDIDTDVINTRVDGRFGDTSVFLELEQTSEELELPGALFPAEVDADRKQSADVFKDDFSDTDTNIGRIGVNTPLTDHWRFEGEASYRDNDRDFLNSFRSGFPVGITTQDRLVKTLAPRLIGQFPGAHGEVIVTVGIDSEHTDYALISTFGPQTTKQHINAIYAQAIIPVTPKLTSTIGLRQVNVTDRIFDGFTTTSLDDDEMVGSLGVVFQANPDVKLFARADENYRLAKVDEHTNVVFGTPTGLKNQTGLSLETGAEIRGAQGSAKIILYTLKLDNEISFDASGFANINLDTTKRKGLLLETNWIANDQWTIGATYNVIDAEITDGAFKGNTVPLVAEHAAHITATGQLTSNLSITGEADWIGSQSLGADFSGSFDKLSGRTVYNLASRYTQGPWTISGRINNLTDKEYIESGSVGFDAFFAPIAGFAPAPERNFWLTVEFRNK